MLKSKGGEKMRILRNVALVMALLVFAVGVLGASIWRTSAQSVSESYQVTPIENQEGTESVQGQATETGENPVDYDLHWGGTLYPGILPDHLLYYPLKMIRDRIWLWLTTDPFKKAELYLKFADKRLMAAEALIMGDKLGSGITTLTKAEKYLEKAIDQERVAKETGVDTTSFLDLLSRATLKHEEVMLGFEEKIPNTTRPVYDSALQYARQGYQRVRERMGE